MNIVVCIKQTFDTEAKIVLDDDGKIDDRSVIKIVNPYDEYAVEEAIRLKERYGGEVTAVTVGQEDSRQALQHCLAMGVDRAALVTDPGVRSFDSHSHAVILGALLRTMEYDLILCGRESIDTGDGQVPSRLARILDLPQINVVSHLEIANGSVRATRDIEGGSEHVESPRPCVISVQKGINEVRYPSLRLIMRAKKMPIDRYSLDDLSLTTDDVKPFLGVEAYVFPETRKAGVRLRGEPADVVTQLIGYLRDEYRIL